MLGTRQNGWTNGWPALACILLWLCANPIAAQDAGGGEQEMKITIIDHEGKPVPTVRVFVQFFGIGNELAETDEHGVAKLVAPRVAPHGFSITVRGTNQAAVRVDVGAKDSAIAVPGSYELKLQPKISISGIVIDETGKAVEGVMVHAYITGTAGIGSTGISQRVLSDAEGRWRIEEVPDGINEVVIRTHHEDFVDANKSYLFSKETLGDLYEGTAELTVYRGAVVRGTVSDFSGLRLAEAKVSIHKPQMSRSFGSVKTDALGRFELAKLEEGDVVLLVEKTGFGPYLLDLTLDYERPATDLSVRLPPGRVIRGVVIGTDGKPMPEAELMLDTWRESRAYTRRAWTNEAGEFELKDMPSEDVEVQVSRHDCFPTMATMYAGEAKIKVVLRKVLNITGTVTDAVTGEPIEDYLIVPALIEGGTITGWNRDFAIRMGQSQYRYPFPSPTDGNAIRIEAFGYAPAISPTYASTDEYGEWQVRLQPMPNTQGTIVQPNGKPAANATVIRVPLGKTLPVVNGTVQKIYEWVSATTDEEGRFVLMPDPQPCALAVLHEGGYALIPPAEQSADAQVSLQPWSGVQGQVMVGKEPGLGRQVLVTVTNVSDPAMGAIAFSAAGSADGDGKFSFDRLPPGRVIVSRLQGTHRHPSVLMILSAGETAKVKLGGSGAKVVGRVTVEETYDGRIFTFAETSVSLGHTPLPAPQPPYPADWSEKSAEAKAQWEKQWQQSPAGRIFEQIKIEHELLRKFSFPIQSDGTFAIDDVAPGQYTLEIRLKTPDGPAGQGTLIGSRKLQITVPDQEQYDLGEIEFKPAEPTVEQAV